MFDVSGFNMGNRVLCERNDICDVAFCNMYRVC